MSAVAKSPGRAAKATGATMEVDGGDHRVPHERASAPRTSNGVNLGDDGVVQLKVHSHVYTYNTYDGADGGAGQVSDARSESPISTPPPGKYSRHRSVTRRAMSGRQVSSFGYDGFMRASMTMGAA